MSSCLPDAAQLPTIPARRLLLRALTPLDVPALFAIFGDAEVCRYWSRPALADLDAAAALHEEIIAGFRSRTLFQWGIEELRSGSLIGTTTLFAISPEHGRAEVGYAIARAAWGHGYAAEALEALIDFAFGRLGLRRLEADVDPRNERSHRVLRRMGFRPEGVQRGRYVIGGEVQDAALYGLLRAEWSAARAPEADR